jgi:hypothetical protein
MSLKQTCAEDAHVHSLLKVASVMSRKLAERATADPSTSFAAARAANSAQDDSLIYTASLKKQNTKRFLVIGVTLIRLDREVK